MTYEFNISPKENLPTVARKLTVTNLHIDTVAKRMTLSAQTTLLDINGEPFGQPEYHGVRSLSLNQSVGQTLTEEQEEALQFEIDAVSTMNTADLQQAIKNILEANDFNII
jgi:hypothetical protein